MGMEDPASILREEEEEEEEEDGSEHEEEEREPCPIPPLRLAPPPYLQTSMQAKTWPGGEPSSAEIGNAVQGRRRPRAGGNGGG